MTVIDEHDEHDENEEIRSVAPPRRAMGPPALGVPTERSKDFSTSLRRLSALLAPERLLLALVVVIAVVSTVLNVLGPKVLGHATDVVVSGIVSEGGIDFPELRRTLLEAVTLFVAAAALGLVTAYVLAGVVQRLMFRLRTAAEAKLHALPLRYVDQQARGDLLSRVTNDLDNVAQSLQQTVSQMLTSVLLLVGVAISML